MKIVIADSLPDSAADVLREQGWTVDARAGRPLDELLTDISDADQPHGFSLVIDVPGHQHLEFAADIQQLATM